MDYRIVNIVVSKNMLNEILEKWIIKREIETFKNCNNISRRKEYLRKPRFPGKTSFIDMY